MSPAIFYPAADRALAASLLIRMFTSVANCEPLEVVDMLRTILNDCSSSVHEASPNDAYFFVVSRVFASSSYRQGFGWKLESSLVFVSWPCTWRPAIKEEKERIGIMVSV